MGVCPKYSLIYPFFDIFKPRIFSRGPRGKFFWADFIFWTVKVRDSGNHKTDKRKD